MSQMNKRQFLKSSAALCLTPFFPALFPKYKPETHDERILRKLPIKVNPLKPQTVVFGVETKNNDEDIIKEIVYQCKRMELYSIKEVRTCIQEDKRFCITVILA